MNSPFAFLFSCFCFEGHLGGHFEGLLKGHFGAHFEVHFGVQEGEVSPKQACFLIFSFVLPSQA